MSKKKASKGARNSKRASSKKARTKLQKTSATRSPKKKSTARTKTTAESKKSQKTRAKPKTNSKRKVSTRAKRTPEVLRKSAIAKTADFASTALAEDLKQLITPPGRKKNPVGKTINASVVGASGGALGAIISGKAFVETPILWGLLGSTVAVSWPALLTWAGIGAVVSGASVLWGETAKTRKAKVRVKKKRSKLEEYLE